MVRLLSIISLILALVLFPPAVLAVISNNAIPGDSTYPIKRSLEDIIFAIASINPVSKAWFAAARTDRRFKEFTVLIAQGKGVTDTLNELVEQTQVTASQITQISDEGQKEKLVEQLVGSIEKYDKGLQQAQQTIASESLASNNQPQQVSTPVDLAPTAKPIVSSQPTPTPIVTVTHPTSLPTNAPKSSPTAKPVATSKPNPTTTPLPTKSPVYSPVPTPKPLPTSTPVVITPPVSDKQKEVEKAREDLEKIKEKLKEVRKASTEQQANQKEKKEDNNKQQDNQNSSDKIKKKTVKQLTKR